MKKLLYLSLILVVGCVISSFVLYPYTTKFAGANKDIYLTGILNIAPYNKFKVPLTNELNRGDGGSILNDHTKLDYNVRDGSQLFTSTFRNGRNECGAGSFADREALMYTEIDFFGAVIEEVEININTNWKNWPNGWSDNPSQFTSPPTWDRLTAIRHEVGHAQGMNHTPFDLNRPNSSGPNASNRSQWLMYEKLAAGSIKKYDADYVNAIECIYINDCSQVIVVGAISFEYEVTDLCIDNKVQLDWKWNQNSSTVIGFNLLLEETANKVTSINDKLIPLENSNDYKYNFEKERDGNIILEIVHEQGLREFKDIKF